ncbi:LOW QUALITY PROTEIN: 11S globulin seed storage protein Jug r 4-like, partial [Rutidosis leptorrhynchoides]|uniref:LOW QUALITY PROTEIN: 11S globulin seed storage protein Jug r 4-like n=1 Tax=Rutidosis leptorrhynchoides TaxID=125765 RepID=UPI003A9A334A
SLNECQLEQLNALKPDNRVQTDAGLIETWNPNHEQFRCSGVAVVRKTIERNGLSLPEFSNSPQLIYIVQGKGVGGSIIPGCPETYHESEIGVQGQQGRSLDQHQKLRRFREGDVIAVPAGVAHWCYNDGDAPLITVVLYDTSNSANQLDNLDAYTFHMAGNPRKEHRRQQEYLQEGLRGHGQQEPPYYQRHGQRQECNNIFCGFDTRILSDVFNVDESTIKKIQSQDDNRGSTVRVKGESLKVISPPRLREEEEGRRHKEEEEHGERRHGGESDNGLEEGMFTMRVIENIGDADSADVYTPRAGRTSTLNSNNLPVLRQLRLGAERGSLYKNGMMVPHWNLNAHSIMYAIRGSARVQVVDNFGRSVFDGTVQKGQILTVPQNYAVVKQAESEGFDWISFKTNDNAMITTLSGKTSAIRAIPEQVLANSFMISREEARKLKFNVQESTLTTGSSSWSEKKWSIV